MAPELLEQRLVTPVSDLFAAGTVLFEALYGMFPGNSQWQPERFAELVPILNRMREARPEDRYQEAEEARQALQSIRLSR